MEESNNQPRPTHICRRLLDLFMTCLAARGVKRLSWAIPTSHGVAKKPDHEEANLRIPAKGIPKNDDLLISIEFEQAKGAKSSVEEGYKEGEVQSGPLEKQRPKSKLEATEGFEEDHENMSGNINQNKLPSHMVVPQEAKAQDDGSKKGVVGPSVSKKSVSFSMDGDEVMQAPKKKGKKLSKQKSKKAMEPEIKEQSETVIAPALKKSKDVDEQSHVFIQSKKKGWEVPQ